MTDRPLVVYDRGPFPGSVRLFAPSTEVAVPVLEYVAASRFLGGPTRLAGLRLVATDANWSSGDGPEVRGRWTTRSSSPPGVLQGRHS